MIGKNISILTFICLSLFATSILVSWNESRVEPKFFQISAYNYEVTENLEFPFWVCPKEEFRTSYDNALGGELNLTKPILVKNKKKLKKIFTNSSQLENFTQIPQKKYKYNSVKPEEGYSYSENDIQPGANVTLNDHMIYALEKCKSSYRNFEDFPSTTNSELRHYQTPDVFVLAYEISNIRKRNITCNIYTNVCQLPALPVLVCPRATLFPETKYTSMIEELNLEKSIIINNQSEADINELMGYILNTEYAQYKDNRVGLNGFRNNFTDNHLICAHTPILGQYWNDSNNDSSKAYCRAGFTTNYYNKTVDNTVDVKSYMDAEIKELIKNSSKTTPKAIAPTDLNMAENATKSSFIPKLKNILMLPTDMGEDLLKGLDRVV